MQDNADVKSTGWAKVSKIRKVNCDDDEDDDADTEDEWMNMRHRAQDADKVIDPWDRIYR